MEITSNSILPLGTEITAISPTFFPNKPFPIGESTEILPVFKYGTDETVYVLVENAECGSNPIKVDLEKGFVIILINLIVTEKSRLSNLIYDKMSNSVNVFLKDLNKTT